MYGYYLYIPYMFPKYIPYTSLACFLIYGVKSRSGHDRSQSFGPISHVLGPKLNFLIKKRVFRAPPRKTMQNDLEITSKIQLCFRNVRNWTETLTSDMSGPAKASPGGQILVSKASFLFFFFRNYTFSIFCWQIHHFVKPCVLINKFIILYKIICLYQPSH